MQHLTHSQQSTVEAIFRPVSLPKRQAMQGKPFALPSIHPRTSSHLRKHRTSVPSRPQKLPGALIRTKSAPQTLPQLQPQPHPSRSQALPNHTPDTPPMHPQTHPRRTPNHTPDIPPTPLPPHPHSLPTPSHASTPPSSAPHTPSPPQSRMQFPNRSDSATQSDTNKQATRRELHAKLQYLRPLAGPVATPYGGHRAQAATHPDR